LTDRFLLDETKRQQWRGFLLRLLLEPGTPDLPEVGKEIAQFIDPPVHDQNKESDVARG
jgi:hypothetical protein